MNWKGGTYQQISDINFSINVICEMKKQCYNENLASGYDDRSQQIGALKSKQLPEIDNVYKELLKSGIMSIHMN